MRGTAAQPYPWYGYYGYQRRGTVWFTEHVPKPRASGDNFVDLSDWDVDTWDEKSINEAYQRGEAYSIVTGTVDTAVNLLPIPAERLPGRLLARPDCPVMEVFVLT